jgi:hypothetical protein
MWSPNSDCTHGGQLRAPQKDEGENFRLQTESQRHVVHYTAVTHGSKIGKSDALRSTNSTCAAQSLGERTSLLRTVRAGRYSVLSESKPGVST